MMPTNSNSMATLQDVLGSVNDAQENLTKIENKLFTVIDEPKKPLRDGWETPKGKEVYRADGTWIDSVGDVYESLQPKDFFNAVVDNVRDSGMELDLSKLTYNLRAKGKIVEFRLPTNIVSFKNAAGKQDDTEMFLNFWTGLGGKASTEVGLYSHRFICENGLRIIDADVDLKVKHTVNMNVKALKFTEELIKVASKVQSTSQVWSKMNSVQVDVATTENFIRKIAKIKKDEQYADLSTRKQNIYDTVQIAIEEEFGKTGSTVWGLMNGVSNYTNHYASGSDNGDYILTATGAKTNQAAQEMALQLI